MSNPELREQASGHWTPGRIAFLVALSLTIVLIIMGVTGTPWPRWLLALTNIL